MEVVQPGRDKGEGSRGIKGVSVYGMSEEGEEEEGEGEGKTGAARQEKYTREQEREKNPPGQAYQTYHSFKTVSIASFRRLCGVSREQAQQAHYIEHSTLRHTPGHTQRDVRAIAGLRALYASGVHGKGSLGKLYPKYKWTVEGDTSSWLYAWPGVHDPEDPSQWGYGGRFVDMASPDGASKAYMAHTGDAAEKSNAASLRIVQDVMNDFIAKMSWAAGGTGNRNPKVVINGDESYNAVVVTASPGAQISVSAAGTSDSDGNALMYAWSQDAGVGGKGWSSAVSLMGASSQAVNFAVPSGTSGSDIHLTLRVSDNGTPSLASWRRAIVRVK
ncbi:hypothetical protein DM02DRAFT_656318 [Periconia macrospinosa]|uniref:Uncharacterized protein n=1 Tax=Periconia macrospinosa TaxID=97972 RepID=A0A2V1DMV8_9PLEO|nr:hypothetical protein DM02DRAFT_656318 [Periconia macrospinosa]